MIRHPEWILSVALLAAILAPLAVGAQEPAPEAIDYAHREAVELEEFAGGHSGLVLAVVLIAAVIILIAVILPW